MSFDITTVTQTLQTHLRNSGLFFRVDIGNPQTTGTRTPRGPYAAIYPVRVDVVGTTLTNPIEVHTLSVRLYRSTYALSREERVLEPARIAQQAMDLLNVDYSLGGGIRAVDVAGIYGQGLQVEFTDEATQDSVNHIADITVPLIVDSSTAYVA